jgi:hypothetical protein
MRHDILAYRWEAAFDWRGGPANGLYRGLIEISNLKNYVSQKVAHKVEQNMDTGG